MAKATIKNGDSEIFMCKCFNVVWLLPLQIICGIGSLNCMIIISVLLHPIISYHLLFPVRFKVLSAVIINVTVFWNMMAFNLVLPSSRTEDASSRGHTF